VTPEWGESVEQIVEQLKLRANDALTTLELLDSYRQEADGQRAQMENPREVAEYIAFFVNLVGRSVAECQRIAGELAAGVERGHVDALRQLASDSAAEQRRCLLFRDKWINKPLPYETLRPLLNDISMTTRDQLTAFRDVGLAADRLEALVGKPPEPPSDKRNFDRRALFTRLFKP
jgi:hypothetical protein